MCRTKEVGDPRWVAACEAVRRALIAVDDGDYEITGELMKAEGRARQAAAW